VVLLYGSINSCRCWSQIRPLLSYTTSPAPNSMPLLFDRHIEHWHANASRLAWLAGFASSGAPFCIQAEGTTVYTRPLSVFLSPRSRLCLSLSLPPACVCVCVGVCVPALSLPPPLSPSLSPSLPSSLPPPRRSLPGMPKWSNHSLIKLNQEQYVSFFHST